MASMLLRPERPYSNNAELPLQPQEKYCAPRSPTVYNAVAGTLLANSQAVQMLLKTRMALRRVASKSSVRKSSDTAFKS